MTTLAFCVTLGGHWRGLAAQAPPAAAPVAPPPSIEAQREIAKRAAERLRVLQLEAEALLKQEHTLLGDLRRLEIERAAQAEELEKLQAETAVVTQELSDTAGHIQALERTRSTQAPAFRARIAELYKLGRGGYLRLLLGVQDLREVGRAYRTISALASGDRERARAHGSTLSSLQEARTALEARQRELVTLTQRTATARAGLERAVRDRMTLVAGIDARRDLNAQLIGELQAAQQNLERTVRGLAAPTPGPSLLPLRPFKGALDWPAVGYITRRFSGGATADGAGTGVKLAAPQGTPVKAVHDGTVAYAAPFAGFGQLVIIDHGARSYSMYGYLDRVLVQRGVRVGRGQPLGSIGVEPTGRPGLFFGLRIDGQPVDPLQWLKPRL